MPPTPQSITAFIIPILQEETEAQRAGLELLERQEKMTLRVGDEREKRWEKGVLRIRRREASEQGSGRQRLKTEEIGVDGTSGVWFSQNRTSSCPSLPVRETSPVAQASTLATPGLPCSDSRLRFLLSLLSEETGAAGRGLTEGDQQDLVCILGLSL